MVEEERNRPASAPAGGPLASGAAIARNTLWNLSGTFLPALAAVAAIPILIGQLGDARFGVLTLAWGLGVLFTLSDLGLSRATTALLARDWASRSPTELGAVVWASLSAHLALGLLAAAVFAASTPWLVSTFLDVPAELATESRRAFYLLAGSIPIVLAGNPLRSVLETMQDFRRLNIVRVPVSLLNYLGPLAVSLATPRLEAVVGVIVVSRAAGLLAHVLQVRRLAPPLLRPSWPSGAASRELAHAGLWLGMTGFALPVIASVDRLAIGARLTLADIGYYSAPYELVTKLWFLSGSLLLVLFPVFSALQDPAALRRTYWRAVRMLYVPTLVATAAVLAFSDDLFRLWLGADFGHAAAPVARWLALGVAASVVGQVPLTLLQCRGRPDVPAIVHLIELPVYALAVWWLAARLGIAGVALAWTVRAAVEAVVLYAAAAALLPAARLGGMARASAAMAIGAAVILAGAWWMSRGLDVPILARAAVFAAFSGVFLVWAWFGVLDPADRHWLRHRQAGDAIRS